MAHRRMRAVMAAVALTATTAFTPTPHGILVSIAGGLQVELAVEGMTSFRVSIANGSSPAQLLTSMVDSHASYALFSTSTDGQWVNLTATSPMFGSVAVNTATGAITLADAAGELLTTTTSIRSIATPVKRKPEQSTVPSPFAAAAAAAAWPWGSESSKNDTCSDAQAHSDVTGPSNSPTYPGGLRVASQDACCATCNGDTACIAWVWATDGVNPNCWPLAGMAGVNPNAPNRVIGGDLPPPPPPPPSTVRVTFQTSAGAEFMASGADGGSAETLPRTSVQALTNNMASWTPSFYCTDGWSLLAVSPYVDVDSSKNEYPVSYAVSAGESVAVDVVGGSQSIDFYLSPAASLKAHTAMQAALEGMPAMLPRYTLGFLACRWGWVDQPYIEGVIAEFRSGSFPIDSIISDFEWYTPNPDYSLPPQGDPNFFDFTYNNKTWPAPQAALIARYREQYHVRFAGIRKPRLGNSELLVMAQSKGWLMGQKGLPAGRPDGTRNTNYSIPEFATAWYSSQQAHYLEDGVAFFWNDEGEDDYFTFRLWSEAQVVTLRNSSMPTRRYFSINRAFSPGDSKIGATVWTGDITPAWTDLQRTPGYVINWALAGQPHVACDIGGFNAESNSLLLARWYGLGAWLPIMRVHSTIGTTPHFPFPELWGAEASAAMRAFLNLRYTLVPHLYSLMWETFSTGVPSFRPMLMEFPSEIATAALTSQFMVGASILVAPVLREDNGTFVVLPAATWFQWGTAKASQGPATLELTNVALDVVPVYVRSGSIITLAPLVQYTDALPGGPLSVIVYAGRDAVFQLYEDDGETTDHSTKNTFSILALQWTDATGCLSWTKTGNFAGDAHSFTSLQVVSFSPSGSTSTSPSAPIGSSGSVCPK